MKEEKVVVKFLNLFICLTTNNDAYCNFLKRYFSLLIQDSAPSRYDIAIDITWDHKTWNDTVAKEVSDNFSKIGANTYISQDKVAFVLKNKRKIFFSWQKTKGAAVCRVIVRERQQRNAWFNRTEQEESFYQLTLQAIYYPLFYYVRRYQDITVLHASAVRHKGKGVLFCGLDGVGKTCSVLSLIKNEDAFLLSDNLVFVGLDKAYQCFEPIRLHKDQKYLLGNDYDQLNQKECCKGFYVISKGKMIPEMGIDVVYFIEAAARNDLFAISHDHAVRRAIYLSRIAGELQKKDIFTSCFDLLSDVALSNEEKIVHSAFSGAQCFRLQMDHGLGLKHNIDFIKTQLNSV